MSKIAEVKSKIFEDLKHFAYQCYCMPWNQEIPIKLEEAILAYSRATEVEKSAKICEKEYVGKIKKIGKLKKTECPTTKANDKEKEDFKLIRALLASEGIPISQLADVAGYHVVYARDCLRGTRRPGPNFYPRLIAALAKILPDQAVAITEILNK